jgi:hypothetical protein
MNEKEFNRFFKKIDSLNNPNNCWEWTASKTGGGYGQFKVNKKPFAAHRWSAQYLAGLSITDMVVCHKCDNPKCVNPEHLFVGTQQDNKNDCVNKKRHCYGINHYKTKLTENDVRYIRNSNKSGYQLAKDFNVTEQHIGHIKNYRTWKHI